MPTQWWETDTFALLVHRLLDGQISIVDDTLLQKLLTHLECLRLSPDDAKGLILKLDVATMVSLMVSDEINPDTLAFGLRLTGILGLANMPSLLEVGDDLIEKLVRNLSSRARNTDCPAIVRSAGLQMLLSFIDSEAGLHSVSTTDAVHIALACLADDSMFVCTDAQKFVGTYIAKGLAQDERRDVSYTTAANAVNFLTSKLSLHRKWTGRMADHESRMALSALTVLKEVCKNPFVLALCPKLKMQLVNLLEQFPDNKPITLKVCQVLVVLMCNSDEVELVLKEIMPILMKKSEISTIQTFAAMVLTSAASGPLADGVTEQLQSLILLPLELNIRKQERTLKEICSSISSLCQYHRHIQKQALQMQTLSWVCSILEDATKNYDSVNRSKLQIAGLNCMRALLLTWSANKDLLLLLAKVVFCILEDKRSTALVLVSAVQAITIIVNASLRDPEGNNQGTTWLLTKLGTVIHTLLLKDSWEVKDSALELISDVALAVCGCTHSNWINKENIPYKVFECLQDEESFVRASALKTLGILCSVDSIWKDLTVHKSEEVVVAEVLLLLRDDTEAIVRRSAAKILSRWYIDKIVSDRHVNKKIQHAMCRASSDLDWEVKLSVLDFWEEICAQALPNFQLNHSYDEVPAYAAFLVEEKTKVKYPVPSQEKLLEVLQHLNKIGFCKTLMNTADDYDVSVKLQVSLLLRRLKKYLTDCGVINGVATCEGFDHSQVGDLFNKCEIQSMDIDSMISASNLSTANVDSLDGARDCKHFCQARNEDCNACELSGENAFLVENLNVFFTLLHSDLDNIVIECQKTTDIYEDNIEMLLKDILSSTTDSDTNAIDCY